ncbi:MAG: kelch repeat-containing protein [Planctomycetota bacterium]
MTRPKPALWASLALLSFAALTAPSVATPSYYGGDDDDDDGPTWTRLKTTGQGPLNRSKPGAAALGDDVYLFGGLEDDFAAVTNTFFNDLHRFDTDKNKWKLLTPAGPTPPARAFTASAARKKQKEVVFYGGSVFDVTFKVFQVFDDLWVYSAKDNTWREVQAVNQGPGPRNGATLWTKGSKLYLFGGLTPYFLFTNDLWEYDFQTNAWTELIPLFAPGSPPGRDEAYAGQKPKKGKLTIYGGESLDPGTFEFVTLEDVWQLDLDTLTWTEVTPDPEDDIDVHGNLGASTVLGNRLYVQGGDVPGGDSGCGAPFPQNDTDAIWEFHLKKHRWREVFPSGDPVPQLKRNVGVTVDGGFYIFAGFDFECPGGVGPGQIWNNDVFVLRP